VLVDRELDRPRELFADDRAMLPPRKANSKTARTADCPPIDATPQMTASSSRSSGRRPDALAVLLGVLETERVGRREVRLALLEGAGIASWPRRSRAEIRKG